MKSIIHSFNLMSFPSRFTLHIKIQITYLCSLPNANNVISIRNRGYTQVDRTGYEVMVGKARSLVRAQAAAPGSAIRQF